MADGPRQRGSASGSSGDAAAPGAAKDGGGGVALKKEIGLVSACGIIVGKFLLIACCLSLVIRALYLFVIFVLKKKRVHFEGAYKPRICFLGFIFSQKV